MFSNVRQDIKKAEASLKALGDKASTDMAADALNHCAYFARQQVRLHIKNVFDKPIPRTVNSVIVGTATNARPEARVFINDAVHKGVSPAKYLRTEATGGSRPDKRVERALKIAGILGPDQQTVGIDTDAYGNLSGGKITQMLSALQAHPTGSDSKDERKRTAWAIARRKSDGKPFGIFRMVGVHHKLFMVFTRKQTYTDRFNFYEVVAQAWKDKIKAAWAKSWAKHVGRAVRV